MNPGSVSCAERTPPPIVGSASKTTTDRPARARTIAAASPFGPEPITTASGALIVRTEDSRLDRRDHRLSEAHAAVVRRHAGIQQDARSAPGQHARDLPQQKIVLKH